MSENKFIARLKGEPTPKSVVEIQNDKLVAPFKSSPMGYIADRDSSVVVAKGAQNWAVNQEQLVPVADDYVGTESDLTTTSRVSGAGLWLNATYTFPQTGDETNPVSAIIAPSAKWVLTLCGDNLITQNGSVITLTMLVKIGATHLTTKQFKVRECASQFSQRLAIDFSESEQSVIKAHGGSPLTVQVLCDDEGASATIYSGMTHLTLLQRKIDADLVSTDNVLLPEFIENLLEGYIIPADYFSRYEYLEQVEDGAKAMPEFTRDGDNMTFSGWAKSTSELETILNDQAERLDTLRTDHDDLGDDVSEIQAKIPESASDSNPLITRQQLLDEEMDIRSDLIGIQSELQQQLNAQAAEIAGKQDELIAGDNIIISGNIISATGAGGGAGFDIVVVQELPATGQRGIIYLVPKDSAAPDVYDEYVWVTTTSTFELIGTTQVDLSGYLPLTGGEMTGRVDFNITGDANSTKALVGVQTANGLVFFFGAKTDDNGVPRDVAVVPKLEGDTLNYDIVYAGNIGATGSAVNLIHAKKITSDLIADAITVPGRAGTMALAEDIEQAVNTQNLTVGSGEGTLYIGDVAGTATIATNNGLDIVAQTKFDTAPTTDDNTTYADALEVSLMRKAQVAAAISGALSSFEGGTRVIFREWEE